MRDAVVVMFLCGVLLFFGSVQVVAAAHMTPGLYATNCGFVGSTTSLVCGATLTVSCQVEDAHMSASGITSVVFTVGGSSVTGSLTAGSSTNGTWTGTVEVGASTVESGSVSRVSVSNGASDTCLFTPVNTEPDRTNGLGGCFSNFTASTTFTTDCVCEFTKEETACGTDNTKTVTYTPTVACTGGEEEYTVTAACDFCDPQWTVSSLVCAVNRTAAQAQYQDPFRGTAAIEYESQNPACCGLTELVSDCTPPPADGTNLVCRQDFWVGEYNTIGSSRTNFRESLLHSETRNDFVLQTADTVVGRVLQPLVFDFDNDGTTEIVSLLSGGSISIRDSELNTEQTISTGYDYFAGDPAVIDFHASNSDAQTYTATTEFFTGDGIGFAVVAVDTGAVEQHFLAYRMSGDTMTQLYDILFDGTTHSTGVSCSRDSCFFNHNDGTLAKVDMNTGNTANITLSAFTNVDTAWRNTPVILDATAGSEVVVTKGRESDGIVRVYACSFVTETCDEITTTVDTDEVGLGVANVSEVVSGEAVSVGSFGVSYPIYWTEQTLDTNNDTVLRVTRAYVSADGSAIHNAESAIVSQSGAEAECATAPARVTCADGTSGAAFIAHWNPTVAVALIESIGTFTDVRFTSSFSVTSPLTEFDDNSFSDVSGMACSDGKCMMVSARDLVAAGSSGSLQDVYFFGGTGWQSIGAPDDASVVVNWCGTGNNVSSSIVAYGMLDAERLLVAVGDPAEDDCPGASENQYRNLRVWKYTVSSDTWTQIASHDDYFMTMKLSESIDYGLPIRMTCDEQMGCMMFGGGSTSVGTLGKDYNEGPVYVLRISHTEEKETFYPEGTIAGVLLNETMIVDYHKTDTGNHRYVSFAETATESSDTSASSTLVLYESGSSTLPISLGSSTNTVVTGASGLQSAEADYFVGLYEDDGGNVWWTQVPMPGSGSCVVDSPGSLSDAWASSEATVPHVVDPSDAQSFNCTWVVSRHKQGGLVSQRASYLVRKAGADQNDYEGFPVGGSFWSGETDDGEYVAVVPEVMCIQNQSGSINCDGPDRAKVTTYVVVGDESGVRPVWLHEYDGGGFQGTGVACASLSVSCMPVDMGVYGSGNSNSLFAPPGASSEFWVVPEFGALDTGATLQIIGRLVTGGTSYFDTRNAFVGSASNEFHTIGCYGGAVGAFARKTVRQYSTGETCPAQVVTADVDGDNKEEVVTHQGVFKTTGTGRVLSASVSQDAGVGVVDITSDTYVDFVFISATILETIVSDVEVPVVLGDVFVVDSLKLTSEENEITATAIGVQSTVPSSVVVASIQFEKDGVRGGVTLGSGGSNDLSQTFEVSVPGTYTVSMVLQETATGAQVSVSNTITVDFDVNLSKSGIGGGGTGLGQDECVIEGGEFNYLDSPENHGWSEVLGSVPVTMSGSYVKMISTNFAAGFINKAECDNAQYVVEFRFRFNENQSSTDFIIQDTKNQIVGGFLAVEDDDDDRLEVISGSTQDVILRGVSLNDWTKVRLTFDAEAKTYEVSVNGENEGTVSFANPNQFTKYGGVLLLHYRGTLYLDYVRVASAGEKIKSDEEKVQDIGRSYLAGCVEASERNFSTGLRQRGAGNFTTVHVEAYCNTVNSAKNDPTCSYTQLAQVVAYEESCYAEAYAYCVSKTFPMEEDRDPSLSGGAVCSTVLGTTTGGSFFIGPVFRYLGDVIKNNMIATVILAFLVLLGIALWVMARKR